MSTEELAKLVHLSIYHNFKAQKLKAPAEYRGARFRDDADAMSGEETEGFRKELLSVFGIGEETVDDILLYAAGKPTFAIDTYTKRIFSRIGLVLEKGAYAGYRVMFTKSLPADR